MKRTIMITGATSGIGRACAELFARHGDRLILNGRRKERLELIQEELHTKYQTEVLLAPFDAGNKEAVAAWFASMPESWKSISILINNAGLALGRDYFEEADMTDWETMLQTNVNGILYVSRAVIPFLVSAGYGHIINIGSIAGDDMYEKGNVYCASKAAVDALTRAMRIDLLRHSIKVTNIKPGAADTEFSTVRLKGNEAAAAQVYEGYEALSAADIADAIFYTANLPAHVCINELTITCTAQANGIYTFKNQ